MDKIYKNTINLPTTKFPMKGNLKDNELKILKRWKTENLYQVIRNSKKGRKKFILHDGPPYANGKIHIGHSVNKILKDIILKSKVLMGYDPIYIPGWDCHGLPIELKVEQSIGKPKRKIDIYNFRLACRYYAKKQIEKQKKDFIRLGIIGDWLNSYSTMDFVTEANIVRSLGEIIKNGYIYKGTKPVYWCTECCSTLAEAEIEYYSTISTSVYVSFVSKNSKEVASVFGISNFSGQISCIIWTSTPWSLTANRGIAVNPDFNYYLVSTEDKNYIIYSNIINDVMKKIGINKCKVFSVIEGKKLEKLQFYHPFLNFCVPIVLSRHVTSKMGTGLVHIAPGHGPDDYVIGKKYGLDIINLIDIDGKYISNDLPILNNFYFTDVNKLIVNLLKESNSLLHIEEIQHSYPHCWRHRKIVVFRTTQQWFINIDKNNLRDKLIKEIDNVFWIPSSSKNQIKNMINNRPDWCISRQRFWGIPITLFIHNETGFIHPRTFELIQIISNKIEKNGIQAWWDLDIFDILGDDANHYHKVSDTLDVWFDSGTTHSTIIKYRIEPKNHVSDMCLEGSDQHRGWFMSSLITSTIMYGSSPYRQVLTHGFVVDDKGRKMSKSLGNVIKPQEIIKKFGADILRLWVSSNNYSNDISISDKIIKESISIYRRIRNTARFLLSNLNDFNPETDIVDFTNMIYLDKWAISHIKKVQNEIINYYKEYNFHNVIDCITQFCSIEMGSFYLDVIKDRQYTNKINSRARRSCQTVLYHIIESLVRWISPIISFTADEIWNFIPGKRSSYVFTEEWYDRLCNLEDCNLFSESDWDKILKIRKEANKVFEKFREKKIINSSLEAHITFYVSSDLFKLLSKLEDELHFLMLTSSTKLLDYHTIDDNAVYCNDIDGLKISLSRAEGKKCVRCWHYTIDVNKNINYPNICGRCIINTYGSGEIRRFI